MTMSKTRLNPLYTDKLNIVDEELDKNEIIEMNMCQNQDINHTEEVIIGTEQGMTFPTKIGTSMCNALIDTGATRSCISEKYYQNLPSTKVHHLKKHKCKISHR